MNQNPGGLLCPACRVDLVMSERNAVEIDYCPKCRGVWLDRGELDKILERGAAELGGRGAQPGDPRHQDSFRRHDSDEHRAYGHHGYKKRRSFLDDLFD
jgi:Zn-finger nucleic acid-binding protein